MPPLSSPYTHSALLPAIPARLVPSRTRACYSLRIIFPHSCARANLPSSVLIRPSSLARRLLEIRFRHSPRRSPPWQHRDPARILMSIMPRLSDPLRGLPSRPVSRSWLPNGDLAVTSLLNHPLSPSQARKCLYAKHSLPFSVVQGAHHDHPSTMRASFCPYNIPETSTVSPLACPRREPHAIVLNTSAAPSPRTHMARHFHRKPANTLGLS
ncbi:hypothetical protein C8Q77DRAFT_511834 [Trametes polyzona]|nr:hypothetical protein C8Q77DRAFT_511834 [Trametes polyzona]